MQGPHQRPITASFPGRSLQDTPCAVLAIWTDMVSSGFGWLLDCIFRAGGLPTG